MHHAHVMHSNSTTSILDKQVFAKTVSCQGWQGNSSRGHGVQVRGQGSGSVQLMTVWTLSKCAIMITCAF